eukprot:IDg10189t1
MPVADAHELEAAPDRVLNVFLTERELFLNFKTSKSVQDVVDAAK